MFWTLDVIWVTNMLIKLQTVRPEKPSKNPLEVAGSYIKSEFAIDLVATLPPILTSHSYKTIVLRGFHILELQRANPPLKAFLLQILPSDRNSRENLSFMLKFVYGTLLWVHYLICLWIWIGN